MIFPASLSFPCEKVGRWIPPSFMKKCQILRRTMRTLLQDLAQKSLKGLDTKACTNWEDRSANSLAYQVSNHSIFLYAGCLCLQSSHLMRAILHDFKGFSSASELVDDVSSTDIFCQNTYMARYVSPLKTPLFLLMNLAQNLHHQSMTSCLLLPF